jgi:hypothetical protein
MPTYFLGYHMSQDPPRPDPAQHERWKAWIAGLGDAVVNPGTPLGGAKTVSAEGVSEGGGPNPLMGYMLVKADSMEAALEIAKSDPFLAMGTIELAELKVMPGS